MSSCRQHHDAANDGARRFAVTQPGDRRLQRLLVMVDVMGCAPEREGHRVRGRDPRTVAQQARCLMNGEIERQGQGKLIRELLKDKQFESILGMDVSYRSLEVAAERLHMDTMPPKQKDRLKLVQGSLMYRDKRLEGFDAAAVVEVIEHLDEPRLAAFERFVLVMTVLENYSVQDCAALLSRSIEAVTTAKSQALKSLGSASAAEIAEARATLLSSTELA